MASDYLLEIDGIKGESQDDKHKGALEVMSFSWGATNATSFSAGGGGGAGRVTFQDFHFTKQVDKASPSLMLACATGEHIKKATLFVRKAGRDQLEYLKIELADLLVTSYQQSAVQGTEKDPTPTDQFSLNFAKIQYSFQSQNSDGNPVGDAITAGWDLKTNKKV